MDDNQTPPKEERDAVNQGSEPTVPAATEPTTQDQTAAVPVANASSQSTSALTSISDLCSGAYTIYKKNFKRLVTIMLLILAISFVFVLLLALGSGIGAVVSMMHFNLIAQISIYVVLVILAIVAIFYAIVFSISLEIGSMLLVSDKGRDMTVKQAYQEGRSRVAGYIWVSFCTGIFVLLWLLLLVIPGLVMMIYYSFSLWVFLVEGLRGMKAIKRSKELVKGHWWAVFGRMAAIMLVYFVINGILSALSGENRPAGVSRTGAESAWLLIQNVFAMLSAPFLLAYSYLMYKDLAKLKPSTEIK